MQIWNCPKWTEISKNIGYHQLIIRQCLYKGRKMSTCIATKQCSPSHLVRLHFPHPMLQVCVLYMWIICSEKNRMINDSKVNFYLNWINRKLLQYPFQIIRIGGLKGKQKRIHITEPKSKKEWVIRVLYISKTLKKL
jgi:hypothetical protein